MTIIIIIVTAFISFRAFSNRSLFYRLSFNPHSIKHNREKKRFLTHIFIHADWGHLLFNMLTLFFFGPNVEHILKYHFGGPMAYLIFILLYFGGAIISSLYSYQKHADNAMYNAVGASGSVSAILFAFILFEPLSKISLLFIPIGIPAFIFGVLYLGYSYHMAKKGIDNIGHDAHFWGAVYGFTLPLFFNPSFIIDFFNQIFH